MHYSAWYKVFFTNLALKYLGAIFGHPFGFNGMKICLGTTLVKPVAFINIFRVVKDLNCIN